MAKDDYEVIVFKILTYLYACLKKGQSVDKKILSPASVCFCKNGEALPETYWHNVLCMMSEEGLIAGLNFIRPWGSGTAICINDITDCRITPTGIRYLSENSQVKNIFNELKEKGDLFVSLAAAVLPFLN